jgi:xylulokinase
MSELMLGVDLGTTGLKTALVSDSGELLAEAGMEYRTHHPQPNWAEQDPEDWWHALEATVRQVISPSGVAKLSLAGMSISSQAPVIVPVDANGRPLMRGMIWADKRAGEECQLLRERVGEERISQITLNHIDPFFAAPKYLWLKLRQPDLFGKTDKFLMANSYLNFRLTGQYAIDDAQAFLQLLVDAHTCDWSPELLDALDLPLEKFPPVRKGAQVIGEVTRQAAEDLGIPPGTPVLAGTTDTTAAMIGMGIAENGQAFVSHGTGSNIGLCVTQPKPNRHLICIPQGIPGRWMLSAVMTSTGASIKWFMNEVSCLERDYALETGRDPYAYVTAPAEMSPPGSGGVVYLPYLMGEQAPIWDRDARGTFVGISATTTRGDLIRAIMEGIAFGVRQNFQVYIDSGWQVGDVRLIGGAARNSLWNQITSDVLNRCVLVPPSSAGAPIGDALLAGLATGVFPTVETAVAASPLPKARHIPNPANVARYDQLYSIYVDIYGRLKDSFHELATFRTSFHN